MVGGSEAPRERTAARGGGRVGRKGLHGFAHQDSDTKEKQRNGRTSDVKDAVEEDDEG